MARRGARAVTEADRNGKERREEPGRSRAPARETEVWVEEAKDESARAPSPKRGRRRSEAAPIPEGVVAELSSASPIRAASLQRKLAQAVRAYEADRYQEALRILKPMMTITQTAPAVRELYGLTLYRMGRWAAAIKELDLFRGATGSLDQHPVLADCHRALGHWAQVEELWDELRQASPSGELVAEGRIVAAAALADQGKVASAIRVLERAAAPRKRPRVHHLRQWYALADLYERAGDLPRARGLFERIAQHEPDFVDVQRRRSALR